MRPEEQSEKAESNRVNSWNEIRLKGPYLTEIDTRTLTLFSQLILVLYLVCLICILSPFSSSSLLSVRLSFS